MNTSRIEELLERLVEQNDEIIQKLNHILDETTQVNKELNWVGEHSFAKQIVNMLGAIDSSVSAIQS